MAEPTSQPSGHIGQGEHVRPEIAGLVSAGVAGSRGTRRRGRTSSAWEDLAACRGLGVQTFFGPSGVNDSAAKAICRGCPVRPECLDTAMANPSLVGVWGGTSVRERARLRPGAG